MLSLLTSLVSVAVAGAMSSVPVSVTIMILLSPTPRRRAVLFLCASVAGSVIVVGLSAAGLYLLPGRPRLDQVSLPAFLGILVGVGLTLYAAYLFFMEAPPSKGRMEKLRTRIEAARAWEFAILGLGMNLRPKAILLAVAAGTMIGVRGPPPIEAAMLVLAYAAVAQSAVILPIGIWLRSPDLAQDHLKALAAWIQHNSRTITAVVMLLIGVFLLGYNLLQLP